MIKIAAILLVTALLVFGILALDKVRDLRPGGFLESDAVPPKQQTSRPKGYLMVSAVVLLIGIIIFATLMYRE